LGSDVKLQQEWKARIKIGFANERAPCSDVKSLQYANNSQNLLTIKIAGVKMQKVCKLFFMYYNIIL
jgi:hypothetical protein